MLSIGFLQGYNRLTGRYVPVLVLVVSIANVGIFLHNSSRKLPAPGAPGQAVGDSIAEVSLVPVSPSAGQPVDIHWQEAPTIVYWFAATCPWCQKNAENVKSLFAQTTGRYRFFAVTLAKDPALPGYLERSQLPFPVYTVTAAVQRIWKLRVTPTTIVVGRDGRVKRAWAGAYAGQTASEIHQIFGVSLPGLVALPPHAYPK